MMSLPITGVPIQQILVEPRIGYQSSISLFPRLSGSKIAQGSPQYYNEKKPQCLSAQSG